jgi:DNA modification methylase
VKSYITWNKDTTPEPVKSRVTRQAEVILHLAPGETPYFAKGALQTLDRRLGGWNPPYESGEKVTDVWYLPTASGKNGHGAEFALSLPGRCMSLTSKPGDLVLDPFVGGGTSALAAMELERRCVGFDTSQTYLATAQRRVSQLASRLRAQMPLFVDVPDKGLNGALTNGHIRGDRHSGDAEALPIDVAQTGLGR